MVQMDAIKTCQYRFRDGTSCDEPSEITSNLCFWHSPAIDKTGADIKARLGKLYEEKKQLEGFQLERADLNGAELVKANLHNANLKRANLSNAHLYGADLSHSNLFKANFEDANLKGANFRNADLIGVSYGEASLEGVQLGEDNMVINESEGDRLADEGNMEEALLKYSEAEEIYRSIKNNFKNRGLSYESGQYHYREMVVVRKQLPKFSIERIYSTIWDLTTAYGESPNRIFAFSAVYICFLGLLYGIFGVTGIVDGEVYRFSSGNSAMENLDVFGYALFYSTTTFTTVGSTDLTITGIGKVFAGLEAYSGPFLTALFIITVYKRYMER